jgi:hypothetical protein
MALNDAMDNIQVFATYQKVAGSCSFLGDAPVS